MFRYISIATKLSQQLGKKEILAYNCLRYSSNSICSQEIENDKSDDFGTLSPEYALKKKLKSDAHKVLVGHTSTNNFHQSMKKKEDYAKKKKNKFDKAKALSQNEFGLLAEDDVRNYTIEKESIKEMEENPDHVPLRSFGRANKAVWYGQEIIRMTKNNKIYEAIDLLENKMIKEDRVMPTPYVFSALISALGRVGYTHKAFKLFNKMKNMGIEPNDAIYTALFNACSNSPWPEDGLRRAQNLRLLMFEKGVEANLTHYNAMIKAFGKCGDLQTAFSLADEAKTLDYKLNDATIAQLLMACISDKDAGFKHSIEIWRFMRKRKLRPTLVHYNLFLRSVRDCSIGDPNYAATLLKTDFVKTFELPVESSKQDLLENADPADFPESGKSNSIDVHHVPNSESLLPSVSLKVPDILSPRVKFHRVSLNFENITTSADRLLILGGIDGFLTYMRRDKIKPDIKTFSILLQVIPSIFDDECRILEYLENYGVAPDTDFFNILIKRRNQRKQYESAKEVLQLMSHHDLQPNHRTFGVLALGCIKYSEASCLLTDMEKFGLLPNVEILSSLMFKASFNFMYSLNILKHMDERGIEPHKGMIRCIELKIANATTVIVKKQKGEDISPLYIDDNFIKWYKIFKNYYNSWSKRAFTMSEDPWIQYKQSVPSYDDENK